MGTACHDSTVSRRWLSFFVASIERIPKYWIVEENQKKRTNSGWLLKPRKASASIAWKSSSSLGLCHSNWNLYKWRLFFSLIYLLLTFVVFFFFLLIWTASVMYLKKKCSDPEECKLLIVVQVQTKRSTERISHRDSWKRSSRKLDELPADRAATLHELSLGVKSMMGFLWPVTGSLHVALLPKIIETGCRMVNVSKYQRFNQLPSQPLSQEQVHWLPSSSKPPARQRIKHNHPSRGH